MDKKELAIQGYLTFNQYEFLFCPNCLRPIKHTENAEVCYNLALLLKDVGEYEEALGLMFNAHIKDRENKVFEISNFSSNDDINALVILLNAHEQVSHLKIGEKSITFNCIDFEALIHEVKEFDNKLMIKEIIDGKKQKYTYKKEKTKHFDRLIVTFALNYGGRNDIVRAVNKLIDEGKKEVTEKDILDSLDTADLPTPDLIIRTSGEQRVSNFMLFQMAYSEFYFPKIHWPDFDEKQLKKAIINYQKRERRFGGLK